MTDNMRPIPLNNYFTEAAPRHMDVASGSQVLKVYERLRTMTKFKYQVAALEAVDKMLDDERDWLFRQIAALERERIALATEKINRTYENWKIE